MERYYSFNNNIQDLIKIVWIIILSVFAPIGIPVFILSLFFLVNIFIGYHTDRIVNKKDFNLDKIGKGFMLLLLYFALLFIINIALSLYNEDHLALTIPKFITWIASYFYLINIVRNAKQVFPTNEGLKFFYEILTIQVLEMIFSKFGLKVDKFKMKNDGKEKEK